MTTVIHLVDGSAIEVTTDLEATVRTLDRASPYAELKRATGDEDDVYVYPAHVTYLEGRDQAGQDSAPDVR